MDLGAGLADEGAVGYVSMSGLSLLAINAIGVELVIRDQGHHQSAKLLRLRLFQQLETDLDWLDGLRGSLSVRIAGNGSRC